MGRLGSTWFEKPKHLQKDRTPLPFRFRQLVRRFIDHRVQRRDHPDFEKFLDQIEGFEAAYQRLEDGARAEVISNTKSVVQQAFALTKDGTSLRSRLQSFGCPSSELDKREIQDIGKVANYWRISRHLTICSRRFSAQFEGAQIRGLAGYKPSQKSKKLPAKYVHAEIQLLVNYETTVVDPKPRAIGVSKEACFLCDGFIRAHKDFAITGAHRQMYPQWTVPDLEEYTLSTVLKFQKILSEVCKMVEKEHRKSKQKVPWRPFPAQSVLNINVAHLSTPSTSTLPLTSATPSIRAEPSFETDHNCGVAAPGQGEVVTSSWRRKEDSREKIDPALSTLEKTRGSCHPFDGCPAIPVEMKVAESVSQCSEWLRIYAISSDWDEGGRVESMQKEFCSATVSLGLVTEHRRQRTVRLADIPLESEFVMIKDAQDESDELTFDLVGGPSQEVRVHCQWHRSC